MNHQGNARELLALRTALNDGLTDAEIRSVGWSAVSQAASPAIARGWTGEELAKWCIGDVGQSQAPAGAVIVTVLRDLGAQDPPRPPATPTPPPMAEVQASIHANHTPTSPANASAWAARIRSQVRPA